MATTELAEQQLLINGEWRAAQSGRTFEARNPYTGDTASSATAAGREDARAAVDAAHAAFPEWSATGPGARRAMLSQAAELIIERQNEIAETMIEETGATFGWGMFNCMLASGMLREAAAPDLRHPRRRDPLRHPRQARHGGSRAGRRRRRDRSLECAGHPLHTRGGDAAGIRQHRRAQGLRALPAHPRAGRRLIADAGIPPGVINFLTNAPEDAAGVVEELIAHPHTRRVNFTGSTRVGRIIAETAGRHLKRALLELGGKAPMVVMADADLERAAAATSFGAFFHQGPDLHVHRADRRRSLRGGAIRKPARRPGERADGR